VSSALKQISTALNAGAAPETVPACVSQTSNSEQRFYKRSFLAAATGEVCLSQQFHPYGQLSTTLADATTKFTARIAQSRSTTKVCKKPLFSPRDFFRAEPLSRACPKTPVSPVACHKHSRPILSGQSHHLRTPNSIIIDTSFPGRPSSFHVVAVPRAFRGNSRGSS